MAATSSSTQGTTAGYTPTVTTSLPSDYPSQFNNHTYSEYFVFKEVKDELNNVSYYGAVKQDGSESGTVYIFTQSADGTISGPIKLASDESKSQNGITFNNYGDTYAVYENNKNNNDLYYGYSSDGEKDSADRSQGNNFITGVLPTNGQFPLTINYYNKDGDLVNTTSDPQTVLAGKYIKVSAPEVVNGYVLTNTEGNQSGEVSEYTADKVGQTWTRHFTDAGLDADYTLNSDGSFTVKVYKNSQLVKTMTVPVDETGQYQEFNGGYEDTYAFPNPYVAGSTSLTYNYTQVGSIVPVDKNGKNIGDEVPYTNDPTHPRKVESNEPVPKIPGYHISTDQPNTDVQNGTVTPSDPNKDTKVVYVKDDTTETESKNVTRTINYVDKTTGETVADSVTQTVTLTRTKTTNGETRKVTYSNWTIDGSWAEQTSPDLSSKGYDAPVFADGSDASKVAAATVNENSNDTTVTVYYPQHSDTTNESKTVKRTIEYLDKKTGEAIPSNLAKSVKQDVTLTRTVSNNKTTGKVTYGDWTVESGSWGKVVSPDLTNYGYTAPDKASVEAVTVDGNTENSAVKVYYDHATTTVTPEDPKDPNTPINPNDPDSPKYNEDQTKVNVPSTQTITYTGAGDKTPAKDVQTGEFDRTVTIDKVTGETISSTPWTYTVNGKTTTGESLTYGTKDTPVVDGYHADKKVAGGLTATVDNPNVEDTVTYTKNADDVETTTESKTVKRTIEYLDKKTGEAIPSNLAKSVKQDVTLTRTVSNNKTTGKVTYGDWTVESGSWGKVVSPDLTNYGYTAPDKASVEAVTVDGNTENSAVKVYYDHATTTVTPEDPKDPNTPINPNDPDSPKYNEDQTKVNVPSTQTITYTGAGDKTPAKDVQTGEFDRTVTIDKVTGETISSTPWTYTVNGKTTTGESLTYGTKDTPVVDGYHADKKVAGGLTATVDNPNVEDTVTYTENGKIIPVDPDGNKIPNVPNPTYPTDPTDPTKVTPDEPVPDIPGYTPETPTVTPSDPGKDTQVVYNKQDGSLTVKYVDQDSNNAVLETKDLSGKYGDKITYTTADTIKSLEDKGYVLVSDGYTGKVGSEFDNTNNGQTYVVVFKHGTTTVTPDNPKNPGESINPNDPNGPKYTKDQTDVTKDASQTVHYTGAGDKTPSDKVQPQKDAFTRTVTIDKVTGKTVSTTPWTGSKTFGTEDTPVVDGYHADKKVAGGLTATPEKPNVEDTVTYAENGKIVPVDPNGNKIPDAPTPTYPTDPTDPTKVVPDEPVPDIPGYTPETPKVTPSDPGKDTQVVYNKQDGSLTVKYVDQDSNNAVLETKDLSGKYGDKITYTTADTIKSLEDKGYVLVSDGYTGKVGSEFDNTNNGQTYVVVFKHGTTTVTPDNPKNPGESINPNDPNGPKYTKDQTDVTKDASQTVHYTGAGDKTPSDKVQPQKDAFTRTVTIDKVTGKTVSTTPWTGSKTFGTEDTPVVDGYHADKKVAGGLTATPEKPNVEDTVTYAENGKIVPVDPDGNKIPNVPNPTYPTDPTDPTKVTPDEPVPDIPGYTPNVSTVTPKDPGKDTQVIYTQQGSVTVTVHDVTDNLDLPYGKTSGEENVGTTFTYDKNKVIQELENKGYKILNPDVVIPTTISKGAQNIVIKVKHELVPVTPGNQGQQWPDGIAKNDLEATGTQTIHYEGAGDKTPANNTQHFTFTKSATVDKVTGKIVSETGWNVAGHTFGNVDTPVVAGYHADKKVAGGATITPDDLNKTIVVTYAPNGHIIPVDPDGKPLPNVPQPQYQNNPNDPTEVTPNEPVPEIPGYTPNVSTVTPENPGENTPVVYTPNKKTVGPTTPQPETPAKPMTPTTTPAGNGNIPANGQTTSPAGSSVTTSNVNKANATTPVAQKQAAQLPQTGNEQLKHERILGLLALGVAGLLVFGKMRRKE